MKSITVTIDKDGKVTLSDTHLGYAGEHEEALLNFVPPSTATQRVTYYRVWTDGYFSPMLRPDSVNGIFQYSMPQGIMRAPAIRMQVVGYTVREGLVLFVWKSEVFKLTVDPSINMEKPIPSEAYEPIENALLQCYDTTENAKRVVDEMAEKTAQLEAHLESAAAHEEATQLSAQASAESATESATVLDEVKSVLSSCEQVKLDCENTKLECEEAIGTKITSADEIDSVTNENILVCAKATAEYVNSKKDEILGNVGANLSLDYNTLKLEVSSEFSEAPNKVLSEVSLEEFARKGDIPIYTGQLENNANFIKLSQLSGIDGTLDEFSQYPPSTVAIVMWLQNNYLSMGNVAHLFPEGAEDDEGFYQSNFVPTMNMISLILDKKLGHIESALDELLALSDGGAA